jgi:tRNA(fMet)-specific endonuclease VapC
VNGRGLLDTSTLLLLPRLDRARAQLPERPMISTITLAERAVRLAEVQQAETDFEALPFDAVAARAFGTVAADMRAAGRTSRARSFDAMIAAVALANDLPLYTCNPSDFDGIGGLQVIAVPHPDASA